MKAIFSVVPQDDEVFIAGYIVLLGLCPTKRTVVDSD